MLIAGATDGIWALRFLLISIGYISGLVIAITNQLQIVDSLFVSAQILGIAGIVLVLPLITAIEKRIYLQTSE